MSKHWIQTLGYNVYLLSYCLIVLEFVKRPFPRVEKKTMSLGIFSFLEKKSRIRETKHLLTDADSSTDTTVGCSMG